jgi:hypothetical protein
LTGIFRTQADWLDERCELGLNRSTAFELEELLKQLVYLNRPNRIASANPGSGDSFDESASRL